MTHLCDSNVFIALTLGQHIHHGVARRWFEGLGEGDAAAFCRETQCSFLRLLTLPLGPGYEPVSNDRALALYAQLRRDPAFCLVAEPPGTEALWHRWAAHVQPSPRRWMDAYLAAFASAGGYRLVTLDRAFRQFEPLDLLVLTG
jgi:hypothetical protein